MSAKSLRKLVIVGIEYRDCIARWRLPGVQEDIRTVQNHWLRKDSGHGVQERALVDSNELDGKDELIVACDGYRQDGGHITEKCIIDDQINKILVTAIQKHRGARLLTVFDCCNSGTILDLPYSAGNDTLGSRSKCQTVLQWSKKLLWESLSIGPAPSFPLYEGIFPRLFATNIPVLCISACKDGQAAYGDSKGGFLTQALFRSLDNNDTPRLVDLERELKNAVRRSLKKRNHNLVQDVQISSLTPLFMRRRFKFRVPELICGDLTAQA
ncbi:hypothetical protein BDZ89DRAFT_1133207 [Hymenopellis radicata]|nr:hypothetical protein BDZ89DRAFT_1133207 [Hymenopellis radicata]